jgi:hypothetical protein
MSETYQKIIQTIRETKDLNELTSLEYCMYITLISDYGLVTKDAAAVLDKMNSDMARMEADNLYLKGELERVRSSYHFLNSELTVTKDELSDVKKLNDLMEEVCCSLVRALVASRKGHSKLTAVMKTALTPEQYHSAIATAAEISPELFSRDASHA